MQARTATLFASLLALIVSCCSRADGAVGLDSAPAIAQPPVGSWTLDRGHIISLILDQAEFEAGAPLNDDERQILMPQIEMLVEMVSIEIKLNDDGTGLARGRDPQTGESDVRRVEWSMAGDAVRMRIIDPEGMNDEDILGEMLGDGAMGIRFPGDDLQLRLLKVADDAFTIEEPRTPARVVDPMDAFLDAFESALDASVKIENISEMLAGSWVSADGSRRLTYRPVKVPGMGDVLLMDTGNGLDARSPALKRVLRLFATDAGIRIRYYRVGSTNMSRLLGSYDMLQDQIGDALADCLVPIADFMVTDGPRGVVAQTAHPFPIDRDDAVEERIRYEINGDSLRTVITFIDRKGESRDIVTVYTKGADHRDLRMLDGGLVVISDGAGEGDGVKEGDRIGVHYYGMLTTGVKFDASYDRDTIFSYEFPGRVIQGWQQGLAGMKVGERRRLIIPPALGYGSRDNGPIPAGSTLVFDVECVSIEPR